MDVYQAIRARKSVRAFRDQEVDDETLTRLFEAVRLAPSAKNSQEWRFVVVRDRDTRERIATEGAGQAFIGRAPVLVVCCAETEGRTMRGGQQAYPIDVAIAIDHLTLAAVAEGLGTCWIGAYDESKVKDILGIPRAIRVVELLPLGYPVDPAAVDKSRLPLSTIMHYERW